MMKQAISILTMFLLTMLFCSHVAARGTVLTAVEASKYLVNRTVNVTEVEPDKKTGKTVTFKAYFAELGTIRTVFPSGETESWAWSIDKNGALCVRNNVRWGSGICGYIVADGKEYKLFRNSRGTAKVDMKNDKVVFNNDWRHFLTFSGARDGQHL